MSFNAKQKTLVILPKCSSFLSMLGSAFIFQDVIRTRKKRTQSVYHRILLGLSVYDFMASSMNFLSSWPAPRDAQPPVWGASGTTETCSFQGFFNEVGNVCVPWYNATLCLYYVLIIRHSWTETRLGKVEWWFHVVPHVVAWSIGFAALAKQMYNFAGWNCWLASYPWGCSLDGEEGTTPCTRGLYVFFFRWLHYALIWTSITIVTVGMLAIIITVRTQEKATEHWTRHPRASVVDPRTLSSSRQTVNTRHSVMKNGVRHVDVQRQNKPEDAITRSFDDNMEDIEAAAAAAAASLKAYPLGCSVTNTSATAKTTTSLQWHESVSPNTDGRAEDVPQQECHLANGRNGVHASSGHHSYGKIFKKMSSTTLRNNSKNPSDASEHCSKARRVATQAAFFCGAMYLTWIFTTVMNLIGVMGGKIPFMLIVFQTIFFPMQGFFNCLIYLRPRYLRIKSKHPHLNACETIKQVISPTSHVRERSQRPTSIIFGKRRKPLCGRHSQRDSATSSVRSPVPKGRTRQTSIFGSDGDMQNSTISSLNHVRSSVRALCSSVASTINSGSHHQHRSSTHITIPDTTERDDGAANDNLDVKEEYNIHQAAVVAASMIKFDDKSKTMGQSCPMVDEGQRQPMEQHEHALHHRTLSTEIISGTGWQDEFYQAKDDFRENGHCQVDELHSLPLAPPITEDTEPPADVECNSNGVRNGAIKTAGNPSRSYVEEAMSGASNSDHGFHTVSSVRGTSAINSDEDCNCFRPDDELVEAHCDAKIGSGGNEIGNIEESSFDNME